MEFAICERRVHIRLDTTRYELTPKATHNDSVVWLTLQGLSYHPTVTHRIIGVKHQGESTSAMVHVSRLNIIDASCRPPALLSSLLMRQQRRQQHERLLRERRQQRTSGLENSKKIGSQETAEDDGGQGDVAEQTASAAVADTQEQDQDHGGTTTTTTSITVYTRLLTVVETRKELEGIMGQLSADGEFLTKMSKGLSALWKDEAELLKRTSTVEREKAQMKLKAVTEQTQQADVRAQGR